MERKLEGKVAVITGGTSGIGEAAAYKFAREGARVIVAGRNENNGNRIVAEIKKQNGEATFFSVDVNKYEEVKALVDFAVKTYGTLDIIVNNAGMGVVSSVLKGDAEDYQRVVIANQFSAAYGIFAASKKMVELGVKGVIINTSSVFGTTAFENNFAYGASKAAVDNMTKTAALELAAHDIRVVAVSPGTVDTPIMRGALSSPFGEQLKKYHMRKKILKPDEIANVIAFLASEDANAINGTVVAVDDGWTSFKSHC